MAKPLALITGGTSGIGLGAALKLASHHDLALGFASNEEKALEALARIHREFPECKARIYRKALKTRGDVAELAETVQTDFATAPSVLVSSHGRLRDGLFMGSEFSLHEEIIQEHLVVNMALAHVFLKPMYRERFGRLVLLSSISARYAKRGQANYAAAKAGLEGFVRVLALEVAHRGVTVNAVAPGLVDTPMTTGLLQRLGEAGGNSNRPDGNLRKLIPTGFVGTPEDVGSLVAFLCSPEARYITGTVFTIDGGRSLGDSAS